MAAAKAFAAAESKDKVMPGAAVLVKDGRIIGRGANGSDYHEKHGCERIRQGIPTGQGYELCEGCHPRNHSEPSAIADARARGEDTLGADLYLWGHWWFCEPCWTAMIAAGIRDVYLLEGSEILFNKAHPENIIGRQFE
jgi:deoxycytidylate deaminase